MKRSVFVAGLLGVATCGTPTGLCGCSPMPMSNLITVYGTVSRGASPAIALPVRLFGSSRSCNGPNEIVSVTPTLTQTTTDGRYRAQIGLLVPSDTACLRVTVVDTARRPIDSTSVVRRPVRVAPNVGRAQQDSVRLDVVLEP